MRFHPSRHTNVCLLRFTRHTFRPSGMITLAISPDLFWSSDPEATSGVYGAQEGTIRRMWAKELDIPNVIVRLLTGDDQEQFEKSKALFSRESVLITTSVILECEWVLRYAYHFKQPEITIAFQSLFGLPNVQLEDPLVISNAIECHQNGMDFADALHLAQSKDAEAFVTFDKKLMKATKKNTTIKVR